MKRTPLTRKTPLKRSAIGRGNAASLRRTPLRKANPKRMARRAKQYRQVLASDFHKRLRYAAFLRSRGLCECDACKETRSLPERRNVGIGHGDSDRSFYPIPIWFTKRGAEPWQRFRSTDGEIHHVSYAMMGDENPDELRLVRWVWKTCHERIEAEHGTRRRYLASGE